MTSLKLSLQGDSGAVFEIDCQAAKQSSLIKTIIEQTKNEDSEAIPISNVDDHVLRKVIEWCEYHQNHAMTRNNDPRSNSLGQVRNIDEWDQHLFGDDNNTIFEIILAANYLEIQPLLDMASLTIAKKIAGKPLEHIRAEFAIPDLPLAADDPAASSPPPASAANLLPPSDLFNPTSNDMRNAHLLLHNVPLHSGRILPFELADAIISLAYRPLHAAYRAEQRAYAANDFLRPGPEASVAGLYLSTAPLPQPAVGKAVAQRVVFQTRAADQGWADAGGHGTFRNSHTWFEASIVRPVPVGEGDVAVEGAKLQEALAGTWETPGEVSAALNGRGWDFVENADDGGVVWRVSNNITACSAYRDYRVMWERGVETQVKEERAVGKGHGFLERLESGFVVLLWARAEQRAWVNKVGAASIEIEYVVQ